MPHGYCQHCGHPFFKGYYCPGCKTPRPAATLLQGIFVVVCATLMAAAGTAILLSGHYIARPRNGAPFEISGFPAQAIGIFFWSFAIVFLSLLPNGRVGQKIGLFGLFLVLGALVLLLGLKQYA